VRLSCCALLRYNLPLGFTFERKRRSDRAIGLRPNGGERRSCLPDLLVPAGFEPAVARLSTSLSLMAGSRRCRSPSACAPHSGSGRGREPSRLTALEWRTTVVLIHKPLSSSNPLPTGAGAPVRSIVLEIGTPGQIRTDNLRVLSATPLPNWATGASWCSRSDSNAHWTGSRPVSSAACDTRAGAAPRIRTQTGHVLSVLLLPIEQEPRRPKGC
jgi:hypothetical protein